MYIYTFILYVVCDAHQLYALPLPSLALCVALLSPCICVSLSVVLTALSFELTISTSL